MKNIDQLYNIDCIDETWRCDARWNEIPENKESITLIWLDQNIDNSDFCKETVNGLRQLINFVLLYTNVQLCVDYIRSVVNEHVFLIVSHHLVKDVLLMIHSLQTVDSIFLFSTHNIQHHIDFHQYSKIVGSFTDRKQLLESGKTYAHSLDSRRRMEFKFFDNTSQTSIRELGQDPASFVLFHMLINVLKEFPQTDEAKQQMIDQCRLDYRGNESVLNEIKDFEINYQPADAIRWYTKNSFVYKLINKALRTEDVMLLHLFRFYIIDLCKQIENESLNYLSLLSSQSHTAKVYRGQMMLKYDIENLKNYIGKYISPNGFFSTSKNRDVALMFLGGDLLEKVLFEIVIDHTVIKAKSIIAVADITRFSNFDQEEEVLFSLGTTFKLIDIVYNFREKLWCIQMNVADEGLEFIQTQIDLKRKDLKETTPVTLFGELLIDMGMYAKAKDYHELLIKTLPKDHQNLPLLYHGLGYIYYKQQQYDQALKYGYMAHEILLKQSPLNFLHIAQSFLNLGWDHKENSNPNQAIKLFKKALLIRKRYYSEKDHVNIAITLVSIADAYTDLDDYEKAFDYLSQGLEMFKHILPSEHVEICKALARMAKIFEKQCLFKDAIDYYQRSYQMAKKTMPIKHTCLIEYFANIIRLFKKTNKSDEARHFAIEHCALLTEVLGINHPNLSQSYAIMADFIDDIRP